MRPLPENRVTIPAFLTKLCKMLNDANTDDVICWNTEGTSFVILNQVRFWKELLPVYYKHNNIASFIRQLNMYGFHKIASHENHLCVESEEIKFHNEMFQRDKPELMVNVKRKVTAPAKTPATVHSTDLVEDTSGNESKESIKTLLEKFNELQNKQVTVDAQLISLRQENTVLWRELANFRQRFVKQQTIVNKLINFLVTIVQPTNRMSAGLGVKRHFPLMINDYECPPKKQQKQSESGSDGPVIHEVEVPMEFDEEPEVKSPEEDTQSDLFKSRCLIDQEADNSLLISEMLSDAELDEASEDADKVFLNPVAQDVLLANLMKGSYNLNTLKTARTSSSANQTATPSSSNETLAVATIDSTHPPPFCRLNSLEDFGIHVESTQNELDQLKDLLNGCTTLDANALLTLFADESPPYGLSYNQKLPPEEVKAKSDPLVSGSELATYDAPLDFSQLFDDSSNDVLPTEFKQGTYDQDGSISTPQVMQNAPTFPTTDTKK